MLLERKPDFFPGFPATGLKDMEVLAQNYHPQNSAFAVRSLESQSTNTQTNKRTPITLINKICLPYFLFILYLTEFNGTRCATPNNKNPIKKKVNYRVALERRGSDVKLSNKRPLKRISD